MKTPFSNQTPFTVPEEALAASEKAIRSLTTESRLATRKEIPFQVPHDFWERQYHQILDRKASPRPAERWAPVLRPALASAFGLTLLFAVQLQPDDSHTLTIPDNVWVSDAISATNSTDIQLLIDEQPDALSPAIETDLSEDEEYVF